MKYKDKETIRVLPYPPVPTGDILQITPLLKICHTHLLADPNPFNRFGYGTGYGMSLFCEEKL